MTFFATMLASRAPSLTAVAKPAANRFLARASLSTATDKTHMIVNAVGADRPGIVADMTKHVTDAGGNVGASQAARLGPHFSLMMLVQVPATKASALKDSLQSIEGMNASIFETEAPKAVVVTPKIGYSGCFKLSGADNPGIVHKVTSVLTGNGLSIDKMETTDEEAPFGGTRLFVMEGIANATEPLSKDFDVKKIREQLEELGESLNCDITLEDAHDPSDTAVFSSM